MSRCPRARCWGSLPADQLPRATSPANGSGASSCGHVRPAALKVALPLRPEHLGKQQKALQWRRGGLQEAGRRTMGLGAGGRRQGCLRGAAQGALEGLRGQDPGTGPFPGRWITQTLELPLSRLRLV